MTLSFRHKQVAAGTITVPSYFFLTSHAQNIPANPEVVNTAIVSISFSL
jgi:hypothetical protein